MKVFAYKSRKDFLKIHRLAKVHGDRNAQTLPVGMDAGATFLQGHLAELMYQSLKTHTSSDPVMPLPITFPK